MGDEFIGYQEALKHTLEHITPLGAKEIPLADGATHLSAKEVYSLVDSPSVDTSLKDGFAVRSEKIAEASPETPVKLQVLDVAAAGLPSTGKVLPGTAIRVLTGAEIPQGADAVVAEEFTHRLGDHVMVIRHAESGRNILQKGTDVRKGEIMIRSGDELIPGRVGLLAAAGHATVWIVPRPRVAIVATGDEVVWPGELLPEGKLYASNLSTLNAWCKQFNMETRLDIVSDDERRVSETLDHAARDNDAVLTSGGAWTGDRDLVVRTLMSLGWQKVYHRARMGPGKAVGFGFLYGTPIFILPGGPPSNLIAFLFLALPALFRMAGNKDLPLQKKSVRLTEPVYGRKDWTQFIFGQLEGDAHHSLVRPIKLSSRLKSMAEAHCIISIPEGMEHLSAGTDFMATLLV